MNGTRRMAQVFVELADTLVETFDVVDFLQMLTERCVELLDADASGLMLADQRGHRQRKSSTATWQWRTSGGRSSRPPRSRPGSGRPTPCRCACAAR